MTTHDNRFPLNYHPDESSKVKQVISHKRNFNHPLFLLSVTDASVHVTGWERTPANVIILGRTLSALCAAGVVAAFTLLVGSRYGIAAGCLAGAITALQSQLFEFAHYMKEDSVLMLGIALTFLAMERCRRRPDRRGIVFLGIGAAVAISGKYLGVVALLTAIPVILLERYADIPRARRIRIFLTSLFGTFLLFNLSFVSHPSQGFRGIVRGSNQAATGHTGVTRSVPHLAYVEMLQMQVAWVILIFGGLHLVSLIATRKRRSSTDWVFGLFPVGYLILLSCSPEISPRYLLPVTCSLGLLAAIGVAELMGGLSNLVSIRVNRLVQPALITAAFALVLAAEIPPFVNLFREFRSDDHLLLEAWVRDHVSADAVVAQDSRAALPVAGDSKNGNKRQMAQQILTADFAADLGSLRDLRAQGVSYVAVSFTTYGRFLDPDQSPSPAMRATYERRKTFYESLFRDETLVWSKSAGKILYLHPGLKLYALSFARNE